MKTNLTFKASLPLTYWINTFKTQLSTTVYIVVHNVTPGAMFRLILRHDGLYYENTTQTLSAVWRHQIASCSVAHITPLFRQFDIYKDMGNQKSKPFSFVQDKNDNSADRYNVTRTRSEFYRRPPLDNPPRPEASSCEIRDFHNIGPHYVKSFDKIENTRPGSRKQFNEQVRADVARYTRHFATPDRQSRTKTSSSEKLDKEVVTCK